MNWRDALGKIPPDVVKAVLTLFGGWLLHRLTTQKANLISYMSHLQTVNVPPQGQAPGGVFNTFSLFLWNQGKAPAKDVQVLHHFLPAHSVFPDLQRNLIQTMGGGTTIHFPSLPPRVLITITYLLVNVPGNMPIISNVNYEHGPAHFIPVNLQRVWPKYMQAFFALLALAGIYTLVGWILELLILLSHRI